MARLTIKRPNGQREYAELTTDMSLAGSDRLKVAKDGTTYYAKLASDVSTHMYVRKNGRKLYVQKEVAFRWIFIYNPDKSPDQFEIPRDGVYRLKTLTVSEYSTGETDSGYHDIDVSCKKGDKPRDTSAQESEEEGEYCWRLNWALVSSRAIVRDDKGAIEYVNTNTLVSIKFVK